MDIFGSVEFYVVTITTAILLLGFILHPSKTEEAQTHFYTGKCIASVQEKSCQQLIIESNLSGEVTFIHTNLDIPCKTGVNFVVVITGNDVRITEKPDVDTQDPRFDNTNIFFTADCFKPVRYHIFYEAPYSGMWAACNFTNKDRNRVVLDLKY